MTLNDLEGHFWTVAPRLRHAFQPVEGPPAQSFFTVVDDPKVGVVRLSGYLSEVADAQSIVVIVHGLAGTPDSWYCGRAAEASALAGCSSLRFSTRGSDRRGEDITHAALTVDLVAALSSPQLERYRNVYLLGYSIGGHLCLWGGVDKVDPRLKAVAAICAPLDLDLACAAIDSPNAWFYRYHVLSGLKEIFAAVAARRVMPASVEEVNAVKSVRDWDRLTVVPRHGFRSPEDYYAKTSVGHRLSELAVPSLLVVSEKDPMVPTHTVRDGLACGSECLEARFVNRGGHVGFPPDLDLGFAASPGLENQAMAWLLDH